MKPLPSSEAAWKTVIGNVKGIRSLFDRTDYVSLYLTQGSSIIKVVYEFVPYEDFSLSSFTAVLDLTKPFHFQLELRDREYVSGERITCTYPVVWKSRYVIGENRLRFTYRPDSVFVLIPQSPSYNLVGALPPSAYRVKSGLMIVASRFPLDMKPTSFLRQLKSRSFSKSAVSSLRGLPLRNVKKGFTGLPRTGPIAATESAYDALYTNSNPVVITNTRVMQVYQKTITSVRTPNFRNLRKALLPVNPYSCEIVKERDNPGYWIKTDVGLNRRQYYGSTRYTFFTPSTSLNFRSDLYNRALSKLEDRAGTDISANIAQDLYQFGQLKKLYVSSIGRLVRAHDFAKRRLYLQAAESLTNDRVQSRNLSKNLKPTKDLAENWLMLQYGWKPLLQDIDGLMRLFAQTLVKSPPLRTVRARTVYDTASKTLQGPFIAGTPLVPMELVEHQECLVVLRYSVHNSLVSYVQQLGFTNPINLAWEVLPFSFVYDWLLPIGPYLSSITAWQGMTFKDGSITRFARREENSSFAIGPKFDGFSGYDSKGGSYQREWIKIQRTKLTSFPRMELPTFKDPFSALHIANASALIASRFKTNFR